METQRLQSDSTSTLSEGEDEDDIDDIENQIEENEELQILETKVAKRKEQIIDIRLVLFLKRTFRNKGLSVIYDNYPY